MVTNEVRDFVKNALYQLVDEQLEEWVNSEYATPPLSGKEAKHMVLETLDAAYEYLDHDWIVIDTDES